MKKKKMHKTAHCDKVSIITKYGLSKYQKSIKYHNFLQQKVVWIHNYAKSLMNFRNSAWSKYFYGTNFYKWKLYDIHFAADSIIEFVL